jgi:soluble P-type ATPase
MHCRSPVPVAAVELRDDAADTIAFLYRQDVDVKVMSGDSPATVAAVAARAGIRVAGTPRQGSDLPEDPAQLAAVAREATVFARLSPDHKRALIAALTGHGAYVAMIGDGVNDVLPIKRADLGIAMGEGSQASKTVAGLVSLGLFVPAFRDDRYDAIFREIHIFDGFVHLFECLPERKFDLYETGLQQTVIRRRQSAKEEIAARPGHGSSPMGKSTTLSSLAARERQQFSIRP